MSTLYTSYSHLRPTSRKKKVQQSGLESATSLVRRDDETFSVNWGLTSCSQSRYRRFNKKRLSGIGGADLLLPASRRAPKAR